MNISPRNQTQAQMQMQNFVGFSKNRLRALRGVVNASEQQRTKAQRKKSNNNNNNNRKTKQTTTWKWYERVKKRADAVRTVDVSSAFVPHSRLMLMMNIRYVIALGFISI